MRLMIVTCLLAGTIGAPAAAQQIDGTARNGYAVLKAEYYTVAESGQEGRTVYFRDVGNKQLDGDFVPALSLDGSTDVSYYIDQNRATADVPVDVSTNAITRAMTTWDNVRCSDLGMFGLPFDGRPTGFVAAIVGFPQGSFAYVADVLHAGWLPAAFFNLIAPNGSTFILGVTFDIVFTDAAGNPVDTDNNGKYDVAWREIYYNEAFTWRDGAAIDIETVALHEAGHGLSQAHFGTAFLSPGNARLHFAPRAVMNAAYSGVQTQIRATDNAGHCSNWAEWPQR
jgi:hypothetical protein